MAFVLADRVKDTTTSTGTGTITLAGAPPIGFQSFAAIGNANTTYYTIVGGSEWEVGIGTYTSSGTTLSRDTVLSSSNAGSLVNFSAGTKEVFVTYPSGKAVVGNYGTVTASTPILDLSQTWNNAAVAFTGIKSNITNTASLTASFLLDLQVAGSSKFYVDKFGGTVAAASFYLASNTSTLNMGASNDVILARDAANTLALRNGAATQAFNIYNTYTDASNYERAAFEWNSVANTLTIGTSALGTGSNRAIRLMYNTTSGNSYQQIDGVGFRWALGGSFAWQMNTSGHFVSPTDNTYDIGASGATRPRTIYAGTNIFAGSGLVAGGSIYPTSASRSQINSPADGVIQLINNAGTDFTRLQLGGTTNAFPSIARSGNGIQISLADGSATAPVTALDFRMGYGTRLKDNADGVAQLVNSALTDFSRLQFGGTTSSFPALKRSGNSLVVRLADDSADSNIRAGQFTYPLGSRIGETADGVLFLQNAAQTDFTRLQFGGTTSSFPALAKNSTTIESKLADNSGYADFSARKINGLGTATSAAASFFNQIEKFTTSATAATGTINLDAATQSCLYYTTNASANWTVNLRLSSTAGSLNTALAIGESMTFCFAVTQGATAYYNTTVQVDGTVTGVTTKWQGSAPTAGNINSIDVYTYCVVKTAAATFTVFASQSKFS
jgi:hypothetical protein